MLLRGPKRALTKVHVDPRKAGGVLLTEHP